MGELAWVVTVNGISVVCVRAAVNCEYDSPRFSQPMVEGGELVCSTGCRRGPRAARCPNDQFPHLLPHDFDRPMPRINDDRNLRDVRLTIGLAVCLLWMMSLDAKAQVLPTLPPINGPEFSEPARATQESLPPASVVPALQPLGDACRPSYWIVSTRRCPQQQSARCSGCGFDYFHAQSERGLQSVDQSAFQDVLQSGIPICVVVHGSFVDWNQVQRDSATTYRWIRQAAPHLPIQMVFFSWPSEGPTTYIPQIDVAVLGRRGALNGVYLAQFIQQLPIECPVSLLGHSHGARAVSACLHMLGGGAVAGRVLGGYSSVPRRLRAVLAAAAIDHHWLNPGERYGQALYPVEGILNLKNGLDLPLVLYPLRRPFANRSLARAGLTRRDRERQGNLTCKMAELDVKWIIGTGHMWPNYSRHPEIAYAISPYLYFADPSAPVSTVPDAARSISATPDNRSFGERAANEPLYTTVAH